MQRNINNYLINWKNQAIRMPLLVRGARQVGKTHSIRQFAKQFFRTVVEINFELKPQYIQCFEDLEPKNILEKINTLHGGRITANNSLLFLDEIQECPNAIMALRYFKEIMPELHVIGAGSLLEFTLNQPNFRMPVGRIQSLYMCPVSLMEFLNNSKYNVLAEAILNADLTHPLDDLMHEQLLKLTKQYFLLGGMPDVLNQYFFDQDLTQCQILQTNILNTYRNDFGKYAKNIQFRYLQRIFEKAPGLVAKRFKYVDVDPDMQARELKAALFKLCDAGLIHMIYSSSGNGIPLNAHINEKLFKILFLDVGLVKSAANLDAEILLEKDLLILNRGNIAEQFVGQELLAYREPYRSPELFYWDRSKKSSTAEVDYLIHKNEKIIPIEVKAGKTGRLKSLQIFLQEHPDTIGVQISQQPLEFSNRILKLPLYMISQLDRLLAIYC